MRDRVRRFKRTGQAPCTGRRQDRNENAVVDLTDKDSPVGLVERMAAAELMVMAHGDPPMEMEEGRRRAQRSIKSGKTILRWK